MNRLSKSIPSFHCMHCERHALLAFSAVGDLFVEIIGEKRNKTKLIKDHSRNLSISHCIFAILTVSEKKFY